MSRKPSLIYPFINMGILFILQFSNRAGTEEFPKKSVVNRVANQLQKALHEKGIAFLVNHGISEEKVGPSKSDDSDSWEWVAFRHPLKRTHN